MLSAKMWNEIAKKYGFEMAKRVDSLPRVHDFPGDALADFIAEWEAVTAKLRAMKK